MRTASSATYTIGDDDTILVQQERGYVPVWSNGRGEQALFSFGLMIPDSRLDELIQKLQEAKGEKL